MKEYTFIYYDSKFNFNVDKRSFFVFTASRFSVAFNAFCDFIARKSFDYFAFSSVYFVKTENSSQYRAYPSRHYYTLDSFRRS